MYIYVLTITYMLKHYSLQQLDLHIWLLLCLVLPFLQLVVLHNQPPVIISVQLAPGVHNVWWLYKMMIQVMMQYATYIVHTYTREGSKWIMYLLYVSWHVTYFKLMCRVSIFKCFWFWCDYINPDHVSKGILWYTGFTFMVKFIWLLLLPA